MRCDIVLAAQSPAAEAGNAPEVSWHGRRGERDTRGGERSRRSGRIGVGFFVWADGSGGSCGPVDRTSVVTAALSSGTTEPPLLVAELMVNTTVCSPAARAGDVHTCVSAGAPPAAWKSAVPAAAPSTVTSAMPPPLSVGPHTAI